MLSFRRWLGGLAILSGTTLLAAPPLTTVQDVLYRADGTPFNGLATISWQSFEAADASNIAAQSLSVPVTNGYLRVRLVPTTNANTPMTYSVQYNSGGKVQFSETWAVPANASAVRVKDVRVSSGSGSVITPPSLNSVQIPDVTGLQNELNIRPVEGTGFSTSRAAVINSLGALDGAVGNRGDCVHVDGSSGPCGGSGSPSAVFVDSEVPAGTMNGTNGTFALANTPVPAASLALFWNGLLLDAGRDFQLNANSIVFLSTVRPNSGDILLANYRLASLSGVGFVDAETPSGTMNGSNAQFTLSQAPNPPSSVALYRNGIRLKASLDFTISGNAITFLTGAVPQAGDLLQCSYRTAQ